MQLTTFLLLLAAVIDALDAQYFQQGTQQFYQPPQQHYNEWQRWQQPQFYPPQQPQHFFPAQMNHQPNANMFITPPQQQQQQQQVYQHFPKQSQMTQFHSFPQQKVQPQIQTQAALPQRYTPVQPPFRHSQQPHLPASHKVIETMQPSSIQHQQSRIYRQQFKISKSTHNKVPVQQQVEQRLDIHQRIRVPPPPGRFVPHLADIYGHPMPDRPYLPPKFFINSSIESLPDGPYEAEEKNENGKHRSYIEDTAKTSPINKIGRISKPKIIKPSPEAQLRIREIPKSEIRRPSHRSRPALQQNSTTVHPVHMSKSSFFNTIPKPVVAATGSKLSKNPNVAFLNCCKAAKVAKSCERICNFDILNKKTLTGMFLGTDPCPQSYGLDLLQCAAQSEDHTTCCQDRGVHTTTAGDKCLGFCNMRPGVNFQADVSMLPCWGVLNDIKSCFKDHIESN